MEHFVGVCEEAGVQQRSKEEVRCDQSGTMSSSPAQQQQDAEQEHGRDERQETHEHVSGVLPEPWALLKEGKKKD